MVKFVLTLFRANNINRNEHKFQTANNLHSNNTAMEHWWCKNTNRDVNECINEQMEMLIKLQPGNKWES